MNNLLKLVGITLVLACVLGAIVSGFGLLFKWNSVVQFSNGFFLVGAILIVMGVMSVMGGYGMRSNFNVMYSQSAGTMNILERSKRWLADTEQGYGSFLFLLLTGVFLVAAAVLISNIF